MATAGLSNKTSNNRLNGIANGRWNIECLQNRGALGTSILNFLQNPQGWFIIRLETEGFWCVQRLHNRKQIISLKIKRIKGYPPIGIEDSLSVYLRLCLLSMYVKAANTIMVS